MITLETALCIPAPELQTITDGRLVAILSSVSLTQGAKFALYPIPAKFSDIPTDNYYQTQFLSVAYNALAQAATPEPTLQYWAECQGCSIIDTPDELNAIAALGIWQLEFLKTWLAQRQFLIITFLRTYQLPTPVTETVIPKVGKFIGLSNPIKVQEKYPILDDILFRHRLEQSQSFQVPKHPELEALDAALEPTILATSPETQSFQRNLRKVLGWGPVSVTKLNSPGTDWMNQIAALGERSKELDEGKSNYQAGTDFEIAVRDSLEYLGFKIDYAHRGGAGGLDLSCSEPYLLIGECKSGKKIPNDTAVQLLNLGTLRLESKTAFNRATKLIIGPGTPTTQLEKAALVHGMAIINPHTLEKLVKLQHQYPGSIDLFELKKHLIDGRADEFVRDYIEEVKSELRLRSFIVKQVRSHLLKTNEQSASLEALHAVYSHEFDVGSNSFKRLNRNDFHNILIELSSPLAGYLGRHQTTDGQEVFYFLRQLTVD